MTAERWNGLSEHVLVLTILAILRTSNAPIRIGASTHHYNCYPGGEPGMTEAQQFNLKAEE